MSAPAELGDRLTGLLCGPRWWGLLDVGQTARDELIADLQATVLAWIVDAPVAGQTTGFADENQSRQPPAAVHRGLR